ncbi:MAG: AAA family ATPase [Chloroflexota bacterium]
MDTLRGVIERITYHNEENGYTVAKLTPERGTSSGGYAPPNFRFNREVAVVGNMMGINVGESVELRGKWTLHADYGRQFTVENMRTVLPATVAGLEKYLGSGLIKGVGPVTAKRIVKHFGMETLNVIEHEIDRLHEVKGVGGKRVHMIQDAWIEQRAIKEVMIFLQSHGVTTSIATKIYKYYSDEAIGVVKNNPYRLAHDIYGIGFVTADKIARSMGLPEDAPQRVAAGVAYALGQATDDGHVFLPTSELIQKSAELLEVTPQQASLGVLHLWNDDQIQVVETPGSDTPPAILDNPTPYLAPQTEDGIPQLVVERGGVYATATISQANVLLQEENAIYLAPLYYSEMGVANQLERLWFSRSSALDIFRSPHFDWTANLERIEKRTGFALADQQQAAVQAALTHNVTVLTGGPGTGKTTTVRTIIQLCEQAKVEVLLAAPTGRAAKRLAETTGREAKTLHRMLEFQPSEGMSFKRNEQSPLEGDFLIVDEASMLDIALTNHLLKAVRPGMHLLLVGDVDQLPSVGAGNVLKDIIAAIEEDVDDKQSPRATVIRLETIFRQAEGSYIITNAHRINQGQMPLIDNDKTTDFFLFRTEDPERAAQLCVELVQSRIPRRFAIPPADIQVLSPMHRGVVGVGALNLSVQAAVNPESPDKAQRSVGNRVFRQGDRVMQIRNNYDKDIYNGDMGMIREVDLEMQKLTVIFDGNEAKPINYDFLELDELTHAYTISIHKSQGSEFPAVVIPVLTSHYMMLQRNLLYTAVTRAKRLVVLVGQPRAIGLAIGNDKVTARHTGLKERLTDF